MFRGRYDHTIDDKGRLSIPRVFRSGLEGGGENPPMLSIQKDHVALFPAEEWAAAARRLKSLPEFDPDAQRLRRFFSAGSHPSPVDPQGRILVPGFMRDHAGLESKVILAGVLDRVEIWSPSRFEENQAATIVNLESIQRSVDQAHRSTR